MYIILILDLNSKLVYVYTLTLFKRPKGVLISKSKDTLVAGQKARKASDDQGWYAPQYLMIQKLAAGGSTAHKTFDVNAAKIKFKY